MVAGSTGYCSPLSGDVRGLDAAAVDVVLDRLDAVLELAGTVEEPEADALITVLSFN